MSEKRKSADSCFAPHVRQTLRDITQAILADAHWMDSDDSFARHFATEVAEKIKNLTLAEMMIRRYLRGPLEE